MSCGQGNFADLNQTWNRQSSLKPSNWDPYPELASNTDCYKGGPVKYAGVTEMFNKRGWDNQCGSCKDYTGIENAYSTTKNNGPNASQPKSMENYSNSDIPCCRTKGYPQLNGVWLSQKPYSL